MTSSWVPHRPRGPYAPIAFYGNAVPVMNPLYYGLLAFSELVGNYSRWLPLNITSTSGSGGSGGSSTDADPRCLHGTKSGVVCCAATCGTCGGTTCAHEPGGPQKCCAGDIQRNNASCNSNEAPCMLDETWGDKVVSHAAVDAHGVVKVMVVTKDLKGTAATPVTVCLKRQEQHRAGTGRDVDAAVAGAPPTPRTAGTAAATAVATVAFLSAPKGAASKAGDGVTWAGQTFDGTQDGTPMGTRSTTAIHANAAPGPFGEACFDLSMPPLSAAMLSIGP